MHPVRLLPALAALVLLSPAPAFAADAAPPAPATKVSIADSEIEQLLAHVASLDDARFVRNGSDYPAAKAVEHFRLKWGKQRAKITSAERFIELCATKSSVSGDAYTIRFADGRVVPAAEVLTAELARLRAAKSD